MGIFGAMTTAISGLRAQSFALEQISGNIANSQTVGYKRNETSFVDLVNDAPPIRQIAGAVDAFTRSTNTVQGDIANSTVETHMGITGDGYFIIEEASGTADGVPLFTGVNLYTRRGDFELDRNGFLQNGAGYYLKGLELDPTTGNVTGSLPSVIRITNDFLPARATTTLNYRANLAQFPLTPTANPLQPGSELLSGPFGTNPTTVPINLPATATGGTVLAADTPATHTGTAVAGLGNPATIFANSGSLTVNGQLFTITGGVTTVGDLTTFLGTLSASVGVTGSITGGNQINFTANNNTTTISASVAGGAALEAELGLASSVAANPTNPQITGFTGTLTVQLGSNTAASLDLSTISTRAQLQTALAGLAATTGTTITINGSNQVVITAPNNTDTLNISGAGATELGLATATPTAGPAPAGYVRNDEQTIFLDQTIAGGAVTVFDQAGAPVNIQLRWGKVSNSPATWNLFYLENSQPTAAGDVTWRNVGVSYTFASNGQITAPLTNPTISGMTIDGVNLGNIVLNHGTGGLSQFADPNGVARVTEIDQNGYAAGELVGVSLGENGRILANYTNGESLAVAQVPLASFNGDNGLRKLDGGAFAETEQSGAALLGAQGTILGQSLEGSNTDVADEFTKLIVTQQAYAAGTRIISTSDQMLQEALNMIR